LTHEYFMFRLARGPAARARFIDAVAEAKAAAGDRVLALFTAQLGWEGAQVALLAERGDDDAALADLTRLPEVLTREAHDLKPTIRPTEGAILQPGGIYVHRWFEVEATSFDEFVGLSAEAWPDFEERFDARIFGLFEVTSVKPGDNPANRRLLLITRYADHGVWEASRDPTTAAMQTFAKRAALTLSTRAASSLLVGL
jgi:hypothetical protein